MTRIDFYTGAENKLQTACKLASKAVRQGLRVMIFTPDAETAQKIGSMLWEIPKTGFLPHCAENDEWASETPIIIGQSEKSAFHDDVLLNLTSTRPSSFGRFKRLIEIVGTEDSESARERFRFYRDRGYELHHHSLKQ